MKSSTTLALISTNEQSTSEDLIVTLDEKYPLSKEYQLITEYIHKICKNYPNITNSARHYLIGKRYRMEISDYKGKEARSQIIVEYSRAYNINRSTVYAYSMYSKHMDIIQSKSEICFMNLIQENLHHNYRNIKTLSDLSESELTSLNKYVEDNPSGCSYAEALSYIASLHKQTIKENEKKLFTPKAQNNIPIKNLPAFDPDAELASLAFTIPSWVSSTRRARKNTQIGKTSRQIRNQLRNQLYELEDAVTLMLMFIDEEESNNGK